MKLSEFDLHVAGRRLPCLLGEPDPSKGQKLAPEPAVVLSFSLDRKTAMTHADYNGPTVAFVNAGHRAIAFDMPYHGDRADKRFDSALKGYCDDIAKGIDPFASFIEEGRALVDWVIANKLAKRNRIVGAGVSRAGYAIARLAAADDRLGAIAMIAPVTDWRVPIEFAAIRQLPLFDDLLLEKFADKLAGRAVHLAIGNRDQRVSTEAALRFAARIGDAETSAGLGESRVEVHVVPSPGHGLVQQWRRDAERFLLASLQP